MCLREKIGPDPRNFNQRVSLGRNDLLIRTFPSAVNSLLNYSGFDTGTLTSQSNFDAQLNNVLFRVPAPLALVLVCRMHWRSIT